jgi:hypothetical protein
VARVMPDDEADEESEDGEMEVAEDSGSDS